MDFEPMAGRIDPPTPAPDLGQLRAIARQLGQMAGLPEVCDAESQNEGSLPQRVPSDDQIAKYASAELSWRTKRNQAFGKAALLGEPTWELLLDLFVNWERGEEVTVTSACIASGVPITTALRYMASLIDAGLVIRQPSAQDGRMHIVHLTSRGRELVRESLIIRLRSVHDPRQACR